MNKKIKLLTVVVLVLAGVLGCIFFMNKKYTAETSTFVWNIQLIDSISEDVPESHITLQFKNKIHDIGVFQGNCFLLSESDWEYLPDEVDGVMCWWAGGGVEIGIFKMPDGIHVKKAFVGEGEDGSVRGDFKTMFLLNK